MKRLNILRKVILLTALVSTSIFVSCNDDDQSYAKSNPDYYPVASFASASYSVFEGKMQTITLQLDKPSSVDLIYKLVIEDASTASSDDFELVESTTFEYYPLEIGPNGYKLTIPANTTTQTIDLSTFVDLDIESVETVILTITPAGNYQTLVDEAAASTTINIMQSGDDIVTFTGSWDQSFDYGGTTYSLCGVGYDMDFIYADSDGNLVDYFGSYDQCPEVAEVSLSEWGNGTWHVYNTVYDNQGLAGLFTPGFSLPVTLEYDRYGSTLSGTYVQDAANAFDSNETNTSNPFATGADVRYCYSFTIDLTTNMVTVFDMTTGQEIATGKQVATPKAAPTPKASKNFNRRVK